MNRTSIDGKKMAQIENALIFIDRIENTSDKDKKIKLFVNMMTYYDNLNARDLQFFLMDILTDKSRHSINCKLENKIKELQNVIDSNLNRFD